ncbi:ABC transporter ATP-binding protein [Pusillimonas sp. CC-YST705]|uniref:ABC transporter ATP-binding protein n=1 Tax=Mesopusillimonas faecipullorum TaxID=2755040 RepID=A0ABS8CAT9_9BURK|nr:ABC transporter ATP-binding protein [Mesopusillimonas faecipullorum]MCB5362972.1 ABC transporter ATP-binding protein [Mesopusillimonas faecipullorum]
MSVLLETRDLCSGYGDVQVLKQVSIALEQGQVTAFVGSNGAGKTTLMRTLAGLLPTRRGGIMLAGHTVDALDPPQRLALGLSLVPEGRLVFPDFTVADTLRIGAYAPHARAGWRARAEQMYELFPRLKERRNNQAGFLSGGEQQMLALARSLMSCPKLLLLDEPTLGLAPAMVDELFAILGRIRETGVTLGLVEQNIQTALSLSDYAYVLEDGQIALSGPSAQLLDSPEVQASYLGIREEAASVS